MTELKNQKVQELERLFKEREKKQATKAFEEIGKLAFQAHIDQLDKTVLMGAFLEISQLKNDPIALARWQKNASSFIHEKESSSQEALIITFQNEVTPEIKAKLKVLGFKWNGLRKEFYGYGNQQETQHLLKDYDVTVETTT